MHEGVTIPLPGPSRVNALGIQMLQEDGPTSKTDAMSPPTPLQRSAHTAAGTGGGASLAFGIHAFGQMHMTATETVRAAGATGGGIAMSG